MPALVLPQAKLLQRRADHLAAGRLQQRAQVIDAVGLVHRAHQRLGGDEAVSELVVQVAAAHLDDHRALRPVARTDAGAPRVISPDVLGIRLPCAKNKFGDRMDNDSLASQTAYPPCGPVLLATSRMPAMMTRIPTQRSVGTVSPSRKRPDRVTSTKFSARKG